MQSADNNNDKKNNNVLFRDERVAVAPSLAQRSKSSSVSPSPYRTVRICGSLPETVELQRSLQSRSSFAESAFEIVHIDSDDVREKREKVDVAFVTARNQSVQGFPYVQFLKSLAFACSNARRVMVVSFSRSSPSLCPCDLSGCVLSAQWEFPSIRVQLLSVTMDGDWSDCRERLAEQIDFTLGERDTRAFASVSLSAHHTSERAFTRLSAPVSVSSLFPTHTGTDTEKSLSSQSFADNDIAVVTGGRGGLGFLAARVLLLCGAKHVVLWSRSLPTDSLSHSPTDIDALNALHELAKERDASLLFVACDVSVSEQVRLAFESTVKECELALRERQEKTGTPHTLSAPLRVTCVVHSAGVLRDSLLTQHATLYASDVWAGKVTGCANLCLSLPPSVRALVAFSSIVAVTGNIGQSAYALANAAMETLLTHTAHTRNTTLAQTSQETHTPLRCVSLRWPGVRGVGMGRLFSHTENSLTVDKDCVRETLVWLFSHKESEPSLPPQVFTVLPHTLAHTLRESPLLREKLVVNNAVSEKKKEKETERESDGETESESERESEHTSTPLDRESVLCALKEIALSLLTDCAASERELENTPLLSLGMDSFAAAELALSVGELYERDLSPTLIYSHPSLSAIADLLCEREEKKTEKHKVKKEEGESEAETEESDVERDSSVDESSQTQLYVCPLLALHTERVKHTTHDTAQQTQTKRVEGESSAKTHNDRTSSAANTSSQSRTHAHAEREDVVVVGLSLDFPGDCRSLCDLDRLLQTRRQTVSTSPWDTLELATSLMSGTNAHTHTAEKETQAHRRERQQRTTPPPSQSEKDAAQRVRAGHYLSDEQFSFDPSLFRISAAEAQHMHPTHKLLLNNVHRALCDSDLQGEKHVKNTGVFVGIGGQAESYNVCAVTPRVLQREKGRERMEKELRETETRTQTQTVDLSRLGLPVKHSSASLSHSAADSLSPAVSLSAYSATANTTSVAAGRISFAFDFTGPCLAIDTACSSSLVALHAARRALQLHECDVAIVAGVNVLDATTSLSCAVGGMLASDAICRTFDANAKGYGRAEGCAVIVLKRESDVSSHERVYCKVRGSAVMQDGLSASLTAPNARSQQQVVAAALADAGLSPRDLSLVEAHGTGTQFGDPVEIAALAEVFGPRGHGYSNAIAGVVPVTAVKASLGHLEPAAGLAGICSALLSMERGCSAPNAQLRRLNPLLARSLANSPLVIAAEALPLGNGEKDKKIFCGVSSFGYSGTIAHVVLERVKSEQSKVSVCLWRSEMKNNTHTVVRSGRTSLDEVFGNFAECFPSAATAAALLDDLHDKESPSAFIGGESETHSVFFDEEEEQADDAGCETSSIEETALTLEGMLWQFSGQGSLKVGSARAVFESNDRFREHLSHCDAVLQREIGLSATELLYPPVLGLSPSLYSTSLISPASKSLSLAEAEKRLLKAMYTQPALVALEYALAATVRESEAVLPNAVLGHSLGEYAAVIIAGVLTLEESLTLVCARGKIIEANDACKGIMSAVRATEADALQTMKKLTPAVKRDVSVAAINGTMSIVLAGSERSVSALCTAMNISASVKLPVTHAFHSPLMKYAEQDFRKVLETVTFKPPRANLRFISTVRGREVSFDELKDPQYWIDHMVNSVRFADAIEYAYASANCRTMVEMGPLSVLSKLAQMQLKSKGAVWTGDKANCVITSCVES